MNPDYKSGAVGTAHRAVRFCLRPARGATPASGLTIGEESRKRSARSTAGVRQTFHDIQKSRRALGAGLVRVRAEAKPAVMAVLHILREKDVFDVKDLIAENVLDTAL